MQIFIRLIATLGVLISLGWVYLDLRFESILGLIASIITLLTLFIVHSSFRQKTKQKQVIDNNSIGIQVGRDFKFKSINSVDKENHNAE